MSFDYTLAFQSGGLSALEILERALALRGIKNPSLPIKERSKALFSAGDGAIFYYSRLYDPAEEFGAASLKRKYGIDVDADLGARLSESQDEPGAFNTLFALTVAMMQAFPGDFLFDANGDNFYILRRGGQVFLNTHECLWDPNPVIDLPMVHTRIARDFNEPIPGM